MHSLTEKYKPILCTPFGREGYREAAPCAALSPYIRCFWAERQTERDLLVIPDTCMDIIFRIDGTENSGFFCTIDENSFYSANGGSELFGVRFYAWTAHLFAERDFTGSKNLAFPTEEFFWQTRRGACAVYRRSKNVRGTRFRRRKSAYKAA